MSSNQPMLKQLMRVKNPDHIVDEADHGGLKRSMGLFALLMFSVGSIIGTGIFVILGEAIPKAGPAVIISFVLAAVVCAFSALSYAELAGTIPVSGSSYSYAYATLGEIIAWVCGWCLMLEYGVSVSAVAVGWGSTSMSSSVRSASNFRLLSRIRPAKQAGLQPASRLRGRGVHVPAAAGASESATTNNIMVMIKLGILIFFCVVAFTAFDGGNFEPFLPLGVAGIGAAAGQVFFSYIGFDAASTAGESQEPQTRPAAGNRWFTDRGHHLLPAGDHRSDRRERWPALGLRRAEQRGGAGEGRERRHRQHLGRHDHRPGCGRLDLLRGAGDDVWPDPHPVRDGTRRTAPEDLHQGQPRTQTPVNNTIIVAVVISVLAALVPWGSSLKPHPSAPCSRS